MNAEIEYLKILDNILEDGFKKPNRTGIDAISTFGQVVRHDYSEGFPLLTTKKMFTRGILHELLWFLKSTEDASYLIDNNVHIWDEWMQEKDGRKVLPHTYGVKWRNFDGVDQVAYVINEIKENPDSRRILFTAWDPRHIKDAALTWCHVLVQFYVEQDKYKPPGSCPDDGRLGDISIGTWQRSSDFFFFLGVPFNQASYSFLLYMIAEVTNYRPKSMFYCFGDSHIYTNHIEQCKLQLSRKPYKLPKLKINHRDNIDDFVYEDFKIEDYVYHPMIKGEVAI